MKISKNRNQKQSKNAATIRSTKQNDTDGKREKNAKDKSRMGVPMLVSITSITLLFLSSWLIGAPISPALASIMGAALGVAVYLKIR